MSIPRRITVNCPKCGSSIPATMFESINSDYADDVATKIMNGELFDVECPQCKFVTHQEYDTLYHDMNHGAMIWVIHPTSPAYAVKLSEIRGAQKPPYQTLRIVNDMNELKEKVACLEHGRDDKVIELCKVFAVRNVIAQNPGFEFRNAVYTAVNGKEQFCIYDKNGAEEYRELENRDYDFTKNFYYQCGHPEQFDENYPIVDYEWAENLLMSLVGPDSEFAKQEEAKRNQSEPWTTSLHRERVLAGQKRLAAAVRTKQRKRRNTAIVIAAIVAVIAAFIIKGKYDSAYNGELRNFAVEEMDSRYTNVYADVVSIAPEYFVYTYRTTKSGAKISNGSINKVVCRCKTIEGETIWASFFYQYYPGANYSQREEDYKSLKYSDPVRLVGKVYPAHQVIAELEEEIGDVFVLNVGEMPKQ